MAAARENDSSSTTKPSKKDAPPHLPPPKPVLTKAERRAKQEKDREAKAAAKAAGSSASNSKPGTAASKPSATPKANNATSSNHTQPSNKSAAKTAEASKSVTVKDTTTATTATTTATPAGITPQAAPEMRDETRGLRIFSHFGLPKQSSSSNLKGPLHPAIFRLGLQFADFQIVGANARCIATLKAFQTVIRDYVTPPNTTLSRHLMTYLNPQIGHLVTVRPLAVGVGNAIRHLKVEISVLDIDLPEQNAKERLCDKIDDYIRDHIRVADEVIQEVAIEKIKDGDVILTYARSSVVENVLLQAHEKGKVFSVIIADSRPLLEGKQLLAVLAKVGIHCTYLLLPALGAIIEEVSTVLLGAHSVQMDGAVYSRAGTALVAMMAKAHSVPVLVCCETYKFSEAVHLDSFNKNELAPVSPGHSPNSRSHTLLSSSDNPNLQILNPLYDLTPPSNITAIVTEVGTIPPTSVSSLPLALGRLQ